MADIPAPTPGSMTFAEPFHGLVWLSASRASPGPVVVLAVSIERSWDAEILIGPNDARAIAESLGGSMLHVAVGETVDGATAVIAAKGDRVAISVLDDRVSDVLILGSHVLALAEGLRAATTEGA